jgi:hypothetical protein
MNTTESYSDGRPKESTWLRDLQPRPKKQQEAGKTTGAMSFIGAGVDDSVVDDCDSSRISPAEDALVPDVEATSPLTAVARVSASKDRSEVNAFRDSLLCSNEILRIVKREVHDELAALRTDRGNDITSGDSTAEREEDLKGVPEEDDARDANSGSLLEGGFGEGAGHQGLDVSHPLENKLHVNRPSLFLPSSATESSSSESSKELLKKQGILIDKNPAIEGVAVVIVRTSTSMTASMTSYTNDCEALKLAPFPNKALFQRRNTCPPIFNEGYLFNEGYPRSTRRTNVLLVHRIPVNTLPEHISEMFLKYTSIRPNSVGKITFLGVLGKCYVDFLTSRHAELAYDMLVAEERLDSYGNVQKSVELMGRGGTIGIRKIM